MAQNEAQKLQQDIGVSKVFTLVEPIDTPNGEVSVLTVRRVKIKDYKRAAAMHPDSNVMQEMAALSAAVDLQVEDFDSLTWEDYSKIRKFCLGSAN